LNLHLPVHKGILSVTKREWLGIKKY